MNKGEHDGLTQALIARMVIGDADDTSEELEGGLSAADEERLDVLAELYTSRKRRRRVGMWPLLLAAATIVLAVFLLDVDVEQPTAGMPLGTGYEMELRRSLSEVRSDRDPTLDFREDRTIEIWLRPIDALDVPVEVLAFARRGEEIRRLTIRPDVRTNGTIKIVTGMKDAGLTAGSWELMVFVGRMGELPRNPDDWPERVDPSVHPYAMVKEEINISPPSAP